MTKVAEERLRKKIKAVKESVLKAEQKTIFGYDCDSLVVACKELLKEKGYQVRNRLPDEVKIKSTEDLIHLFYNRLSRKLFNNTIDYRNPKMKDLATAKQFVESRMDVSDLGHLAALQECAEIIEVIFKHYEDFNFKYPINFGIFGQSKMAWVTEKAMSVINREKVREKDILVSKMQDEIEKEYGKEMETSMDELDEIIARLEGKK